MNLFFQIEKRTIKCPHCQRIIDIIKGPADRTYKDEMEYWMKVAEHYYHEFKKLEKQTPRNPCDP